MGYVELHAHSAFTFLEGASLPEQLVERATDLGLEALAITDRDNPAVVGCRDSGLMCYGSANRAVTALGHLWSYASHRRHRSE